MSWDTLTLSTATSLARLESEVTQLVPDQIDGKIALAKKILGRRLENLLCLRGITADETDGRTLIDVIANPGVFDLTSDYLTLHLIFSDLMLSMGQDSYRDKAEFHRREFEQHFERTASVMNLDINLDGNVDQIRANLFTTGRMTR